MEDVFKFFAGLFYNERIYNKLTCFEFGARPANASNKGDEVGSCPGMKVISTPAISEMYPNFIERQNNK